MAGTWKVLLGVAGVAALVSGCQREINQSRSVARRPIVLKTAAGVAAADFRPFETVQFTADRLSPRTGYTVRVVQENGEVVKELRLSTDQSGQIPETILWHDVATVCIPGKQRPDRACVTRAPEWEIIDPGYTNKRYTVQVLQDGRILRETPFRVADELGQPRLYAADAQGYPTSGFILGQDDVWVVGRNFPKNSVVRLWAVPNSNDWREGAELQDVTKQYDGRRPALFELQGEQNCFKKLLWPRGLTSSGSYDAIAEVITYPWGRYHARQPAQAENVVASLSYSGFVVQRRPGEAEPLEMDLAGTRQSPLTYKETFLTTENVFVGVDPSVQPSYIGQTAGIYIVADKPDAQWVAGTPLLDVSGFVETVTINGVCGNCWATLAWAAPLTPGRYDVVLDFNQNGKYDPGIDLIDSLDPAGFTVSEIRVDTISFNYSGSGAVTILDNTSNTNVTAPEYAAAATAPVKPAAWVRGGAHSVRVNFKAVPGIASAEIWATGGLGGLNSSGAPVTVSFSGGQGQATFAVNTVPNTVGKHLFRWDWKYRVSSTTHEMGATGDHLLYTVLATPIAPLGTGSAPPPLHILDFACTWAGGATTSEQVCAYLLNNGFAAHYTWVGNCHVLASDLVRLTSTQGVNASLHRWAKSDHYPFQLEDTTAQKTKAIDPVGPSYGYGTQLWNFHQWAQTGTIPGTIQRDPSSAVSMVGAWGDYEDNLYTDYRKVISVNGYTHTDDYVANQPGQSVGCEAPAHRVYMSNPPFYSWLGPDR